ncbi:unnamed protein product [Nesidiocoris tenuis]|uniref:Uncharacterized protein n=1 Tax=Nesidiocoris tenuis TaxID=355587 RepID=A0A6H5HJY6_9HEMI|nr:unnamed protein product [Nesidiocoris tenuis]
MQIQRADQEIGANARGAEARRSSAQGRRQARFPKVALLIRVPRVRIPVGALEHGRAFLQESRPRAQHSAHEIRKGCWAAKRLITGLLPRPAERLIMGPPLRPAESLTTGLPGGTVPHHRLAGWLSASSQGCCPGQPSASQQTQQLRV